MKKVTRKSIEQVVSEINAMVTFLQEMAKDQEDSTAEENLRYLRDKLDDMTGYDELHEESNG